MEPVRAGLAEASPPAGVYGTRAPAPALAPYIESFWWMDAGSCPIWTEHVLPHASIDLVMVLSGAYQRYCRGSTQRIADARVMGVHLTPVDYQHCAGDRLLGVRFRAHGLLGFGLEGPARELLNQAAAVRDVLGPQFVETMRDLPEATPSEGIARLERWFAARLRVSTRTRSLLAALSRLESGASVSQVAQEVGWGVRTFERAVVSVAGLSPKQWQSLRRFERTVHALDCRHRHEGFGLVTELGYADQPHFVRAYRRYAGATPSSRWSGR